MTPFQNILVPVDLGLPSEHAIELALGMGKAFDAKVTLLHVSWLPAYYDAVYAEGLAFPLDELPVAAKKMIDESLAKARLVYDRTESIIVAGRPWEKILDTAKECGADLIVMGTHGRRGVAHVYFGSVAEKIVRHAPIPVLTTAGPGQR